MMYLCFKDIFTLKKADGVLNNTAILTHLIDKKKMFKCFLHTCTNLYDFNKKFGNIKAGLSVTNNGF